MTYSEIIAAAIRSYIINLLAAQIVNDIATNGLTAADEAVIDTFLSQTAP